MKAFSAPFILAILYEFQTIVTGLVAFDELWNSFKKDFGKKYDEAEEALKRGKWENLMFDNMNHNMKYMIGAASYQRGLNYYSDMDDDEFQKTMTGYNTDKPCVPNGLTYTKSGQEVPERVDWREEGAVTPVKDQKGCSCCWAFAAVGSWEGIHKLKSNALVSFSEQQLVDCSSSFGNAGCENGLICYALDYARSVHGIATEESYPYENRKGPCRFSKAMRGSRCHGYIDIPSGDEEALMHAVANIGPIAAGIYACKEFLHYKRGIFYEPTCYSNKPNHAVTVIGYGTEGGTDYWLIKNSWGTTWGEDGYGKIARNRNNLCGLASNALFPRI